MTRNVRLPSLGTVPREWGPYAQQWLAAVKTHIDNGAAVGVTQAQLDAAIAGVRAAVGGGAGSLSLESLLGLLTGQIGETQLTEELAAKLGVDTPDADSLAQLVQDLFDLTNPLPIDHGGTGQTTANDAFNALAPDQAAAAQQYLRSDGANANWDWVYTKVPFFLADGTRSDIAGYDGTLPFFLADGTPSDIGLNV